MCTKRLFVELLICTAFLATARGQSEFPPQNLLDRITAQGIRAHMEFLADDLLEGRETGTRGYELAANYVRAQFEQFGLDAAGENGTYFQKIRFRKLTPIPDHDSFVIHRDSGDLKLGFGRNFLMEGDAAREDSSADGEMIFVGYGVTAPEQSYDDYAAVDVNGKIVVFISNAPASFSSTDRALHSDGVTKLRNAAAHGAIGAIGIWAGEETKNTPWEKMMQFFSEPIMRWLDSQSRPNDYVPEIHVAALVNEEAARVMFQGAVHTFDEALASLEKGQPISFPLAGIVELHEAARYGESESSNIAAVLYGSDPTLKNEYVVFTAHADHVGIGEPVNGDPIYNGAVDNASGTSALLEIARAFSATEDRPKRSILFLVVTGEEEGLLGSDYFARHPTVPASQIVADINIDGISVFYEFKDIVALGSDHSSLRHQVLDVARRLHLQVSPDPMPEENFFIRSDQYSFVKQGIPALAISEGFKTVDPSLDGKKIVISWMTSIYHSPKDDMKQPLNFQAARLCTQVLLAVGYEVATAPTRPAWNPRDMFGQRFVK